MFLSLWRFSMKLYSKDELKDSRIFFDKQPPNYIKILGWFFVLLTFSSFAVLRFVPKNYIVRAQGSIEAEDKLYVTPLSNGGIVEIHQEEGAYVKKGDLLLTLSIGTEGVYEQEVDAQILEAKRRVEIFDKYEQSLNEKKNLLDNEGMEQEFYGKVEYYLTQLEDENKQQDSENDKLNLLQKDLVDLADELSVAETDMYDVYLKEFSRKKEDLNGKVEKKNEVEKKIETIKNVETPDDTTSVELATFEQELEAIESEITALNREIEDIYNTYKLNLDDKQKAIDDEIKGKEQEITELKLKIGIQSTSTYQQLISELGSARTQNDDKIIELEGQKNVKSADSNLMKLFAGYDGIVHYLMPIQCGLGLQAFQPVAQINSGENTKLIAECFISAQDRSNIEVGNTAKVALSGVNQTKYGLLQGEVISIGAGTIAQNTGNETQLLYQVVIDLQETKLGDETNFVKAEASMPVIANIVYDKETYLEWLLEQLNFTKES